MSALLTVHAGTGLGYDLAKAVADVIGLDIKHVKGFSVHFEIDQPVEVRIKRHVAENETDRDSIVRITSLSDDGQGFAFEENN